VDELAFFIIRSNCTENFYIITCLILKISKVKFSCGSNEDDSKEVEVLEAPPVPVVDLVFEDEEEVAFPN
jgi:hypothetical protein